MMHLGYSSFYIHQDESGPQWSHDSYDQDSHSIIVGYEMEWFGGGLMIQFLKENDNQQIHFHGQLYVVEKLHNRRDLMTAVGGWVSADFW